MINLLLITLLGFNSAPGDSAKLKLYYNDSCINKVWLNKAYYFTRINDTVKIRVNSQTGECSLPSNGIYKLHLMENGYPLTYSYNGASADTINYPKVYFGISVTTAPAKSGYCICETMVNGDVVEFFKKNLIRLKGHFNKGRLIGKLTYYDLNGDVIKTEEDPRKKRKR